MPERKPEKQFSYPPDGKHMCRSGRVRAAWWGKQILTGEMEPEEIEKIARQGQRALDHNASVPKRNLIALIVFAITRRGQLTEYVNEDGDFVGNNGDIQNINDPKFDRLRGQLEEYHNRRIKN